jgi:hypothetical protein
METKNCPNKARKATQTFNFLASLINGNFFSPLLPLLQN